MQNEKKIVASIGGGIGATSNGGMTDIEYP